MKNKDLEQLERYLLDRMSPEERVSFEELLKKNPELESKKKELEEVILAVEYGILADKLRQHSISPQNENEAGTSEDSRRDPQRSATVRNLRPWLIAASVLFIGMIAYFTISQWAPFRSAEMDRIFYNDPGLPTFMGETDRYEFFTGMVDYKSGNYREAVERWSQVKDVGKDTVDYYIGMAWMNMNKWEKGKESLEKVSEESAMKSLADWYLVRVNIELQDFAEAAALLEKIPEDQEGYNEAKEYLERVTAKK